VKHRVTEEVVVGGVLGPIDRPEVVIAGRYRGDELVMVGRTVPLDPRQSAGLGAVLRPAIRLTASDELWEVAVRQAAVISRLVALL
jgi:hypothetical protein